MNIKFLPANFFLVVLLFVLPLLSNAQEKQTYTLTSESVANGKTAELNEAGWKFRAGDDPNWASPEFDDSEWEKVKETTIKPELIANSGWNGHAWFRLHLRVDESLQDKTFALMAGQNGATEIYLDGQEVAEFGKITETKISEYNPNELPIPFRFTTTGEHLIAVRFASKNYADLSDGFTSWLMRGGFYPRFSLAIKDASELSEVINQYAAEHSMRGGFLFFGVLSALALLHFLLYLFYRDERANLFYSLYAASFGFFLLCNNFLNFGHLTASSGIVLIIITNLLFYLTFIALLAFIHVAFQRPLGKLFRMLAVTWAINMVLEFVFLNNLYSRLLTNVLIGLSFTFCILILVNALREKRPGAWILMVGVQILMLGMTANLLKSFKILSLPEDFNFLLELTIILGVPVAVSVFLARSSARTNRDLKTQLIEVENLSQQKIEHERQAAELRAENERRAKELEEARQLQISMLPKKLPAIPNLEIAAYMKPATEVGGDYYDFHVSPDGTLTIAVGDATGHGLKAGTVVTATKSLFNSLADAPNIPDTLRQISRSLKAMNLRGLFMALTLMKLKDNYLSICAAGMPSTLVYRAANKTIEEISIRALPLGSLTNFNYRGQELVLQTGDCVMVMSDGFPEMFNPAGEMLGFEKGAEVLREFADHTPREIIDRFVEVSRKWADSRPADDDMTFVVLKIV